MADNLVFQDVRALSVVCSDPATPASGDPVRYGALGGVAVTDESAGGNPTGYTSVDFGAAVYTLSVKAVDDSGNSGVAVGDALFYVDADSPKLSKKQSGYFFGFALQTVTSGGTATIQVMRLPTAGSGAIGTGAVTTTKIADAAVTAAKLTTTMQKGYIPLPLSSFREIASNDIPNTAGDAGVLSSNTTPTLARVNGATDKQLRIGWAGGNADEITLGGIAAPPDLDDTAAVTVNILAAMAGATDTPVMAISFWENTGDTNAGGNTAAITGTALAQYSKSIAGTDIGAYPKVWTIGMAPGTHATDAVYVYAAWLEYTRK